MMKSFAVIVSMAALVLSAGTYHVSAADNEVTITGEGKCAKCALHQTDKCQTAIQTEKDGKTVTYLLAQNDVSKKFHENICQDTKKVTATGTVKEEDGKMILTASKIELAKK